MQRVPTRVYEARQIAAATTARGYVIYINIRPDRPRGVWLCDECMTRMKPSRFGSHANQHREY